MPEESHKDPLAPAGAYLRSDEESVLPVTKPPHHQRRSSKCFVYILAAIVIQSALFLAFALAVLRVKSPKLKFTGVTIESLEYSNSSSSSPSSLNATLVSELLLENTNFGRFEFENATTVSVIYAGTAVIGEGVIKGGRARARERERTKLTMDATSNRLLVGYNNNNHNDDKSKNLTSDINSGVVKLTSHARLRGRVEVLSFVKRWTTADMNCSMSLHLSTQMIQDLRCN